MRMYVKVLVLLFLTQIVMANDNKVTVILTGDSTVAAYKDKVRPLSGWGEFLPYFFKKNVSVINYAESGASARTFRAWKKWAKVMRKVKKGDYVFIQFGHNDEKANRTQGYADPDTTFQENLKAYVKEVRAVGAIPVLITPPVRLIYDQQTKTLKETHLQSLWHAPAGTKKTSTTYHDAVRKVAKETKTPLLDLNKLSRERIEKIGNYEEMKTYYRFLKPGHKNYPKGIKDTTHFSFKGSVLMAKCVADEIRKSKLPLKSDLIKKDKINLKKFMDEFTKK